MSGTATTTEHTSAGPAGQPARPELSAAGVLGLATLYFGIAWIVQALVVPGLDFATFWPPVGVWIAAYLLSPTRRWAAITVAFAVAHVAFTVVAGYRLEYTIGFLVVDVVDPLVGAALVRAAVHGQRVTSPRALARVLAALAASSAVSALGGTAVGALVERVPIAETLVLWWAGDFLGAVLVVPAVVAGVPALRRAEEGVVPEGAALTLLAVLAASVVFRTGPDVPVLEFLLVPPFLWAALRFGIPAVSAVGAIDALIALATVRAGTGPLIQAGYDPPIVSGYLQLLIGVELVAFQVLAAAMLERRRAVEEARAAEERFHAFLQHSPVPLFVKDAQGRLLATSESFLTRVDRAGDVTGKHNTDVFPPEIAAEVDESDARVLRELAPHRYVSVHHGRTYDTVKFPVPRPGDVPLIGGISQDVTEQRIAESTTRMAALGTLAAGVAHEINNPLSFVLANVSYASERLADAPQVPQVLEAEEALREAHDGAVRVRDIVRDLRSFARPHDAPARGAVDVRVPLRAALTMAQNELRHRARLVEELRDPPPVLANEHQLAQVLLNLVVNAAQAIPEGRADANEVRVRTGATTAGDAFVEVHDTGRGMAEDERRRVFEPFFTTKPVGGGLGLGLFLSQNLVRALGGRIEVESATGRGSTFRVVLPAAAVPHARAANGAPAGALERPPAEPSAQPVPMRVLVVDDEPLVGRSVERMLRKDHRVEVLTDPRAALERLAAGERYDAILCDLMMPQMSGMEFDARLAALIPELRARTIFMTGGAFTPGAQTFLAGPGRRSLAKPFDAGALRHVLAEVRGGPGAEPPAGWSSEGS